MAEEAAREAAQDGPDENPRLRMRRITEELARSAQKSFNEDLATLLAGIRGRYGVSPNFGRAPEFMAAGPDAQPPLPGFEQPLGQLLDLMDKHVGEIILWLPLPAVGQRIARELARRLLMAARMKYVDSGEKKEALAQMLADAGGDLRQMLRESYGQIAVKVLELRDQWLEERGSRLEIRGEGRKIQESIEACERNAERLRALRARLARHAEKP